MLEKGDLKFRLKGKKLKGDFVLARMRSRRPGSKGNEWLLIKHRGAGADVPGFDAGSREWQSSKKASPAARGGKNAWLADSIAKADRKKRATAEHAEGAEKPA